MFTEKQDKPIIHRRQRLCSTLLSRLQLLNQESVMIKTNRRKPHARELLQKALIELISERDYDSITIQDIVERAHFGRTTFYKHYASKDELFISCHESIVSQFYFGPHHPYSRGELLSPETPHGVIAAYRHLAEARKLLYSTFQGKVSLPILRQIRDRSAREIEANLRAAFAGVDSTVPLELLANYLAGAQIALVQWWLEKRRSQTPEELAKTFHLLQRAAIRDAFGIEARE